MRARSAIVVGGPSGAGKDTFIQAVLARHPDTLTHGLIATTRPPRPGEADGRERRFLSVDAFEALASEGRMFECASYAGNLYGRLWSDLETDGCVITQEVWGFEALRLVLPVTTVFVVPPSIDELARRLLERGMDDEEEFVARLESAEVELARRPLYDYCVVNDRLERALAEFFSIVDPLVDS